MARHSFLLMSAILLLTCCAAVGPDYQRVDPSVPATFASLEAGVTTSRPIPPEWMMAWWRIFRDPPLDSLMGRAVMRNFDLRIAGARVVQARALRGVTSSSFYPEGEVSSTYQRSRSTRADALRGLTTAGGDSELMDRESDLYQAGFDASWEVDLFGGIRRQVEAADADLAASEEAWRDILISLQGDVARNYIDIRAFQLRREIARRDVKVRQDNVRLNEVRFKAGLITELELARSRGALANAQSIIPLFETSLSAAMHRLGVLLGQEPISLVKELDPIGALPHVPEALPAGLPSDLLSRRPDIRKAERELAAATARIGVSKADLFPRFSLTGSFGFQGRSLDTLADEEGNFWRIGPTLRWNVLNLKRIFSNIEVSQAIREGSLANYEKMVLNALEEVENALTTLSKEERRGEILTDAVQANGTAADLAWARYMAGLESYLAVIDAQAALHVSQDQLAISRQNAALGLVALYKALGGGWQDTASEMPGME